MLLLLLIPIVTGLFNFDYMKASFRNVEGERELFMFLGNETSMYLQTKELVHNITIYESHDIIRFTLLIFHCLTTQLKALAIRKKTLIHEHSAYYAIVMTLLKRNNYISKYL